MEVKGETVLTYVEGRGRQVGKPYSFANVSLVVPHLLFSFFSFLWNEKINRQS